MPPFSKKILILLSVIISIQVQSYNLPDIGNSSAISLSYKDERILGEHIYVDVQRELPLINDPLIEAYIQNLGTKLLNSSNKHYEDFHFFIVDSTQINAFALPGGYIGVNRGLITAAEDESELAAVLAHEITHVNQRHIARSFEKQQQLQLPMIAGVIAGALVSAYNPYAGQSLIAGSMAAGNQALINYTRSNEEEADRIGMSVLVKSGYSPYSMGSFFNKLQRGSYADKDSFPEYLRTHPVTDNRISDANSRADEIFIGKNKNRNKSQMKLTLQQVPTVSNQNEDEINFVLIKSLLNYNKNNNLRAFKYSEDTGAQQFAMGYHLLRSNNFQEANGIFKNLHAKFPKNTTITSLYAETMNKDPKAALSLLAEQLKFTPNNTTISLQYARLALANNQIQESIDILKKITKSSNSYPPTVNLLLAECYNKLNQKWQANIAYADYSIQKGDLSAAIMQLKSTNKFDKLTNYQQKITDYKIQQLEERYKERQEQLKAWL